MTSDAKTDISREAVDALCRAAPFADNSALRALRAALDEAEARARDAVLDALAARGQAAMACEAQLRAEAQSAALVEAAEDAEYDLLQWIECSKSLTAAGFNMDGTAEVTAKLTAALSQIKGDKTNG